MQNVTIALSMALAMGPCADEHKVGEGSGNPSPPFAIALETFAGASSPAATADGLRVPLASTARSYFRSFTSLSIRSCVRRCPWGVLRITPGRRRQNPRRSNRCGLATRLA